MAEPGTPLPSSKASGEDEASVLLGYLTYHRTVLARKAEGLSDEQARRPACPPSALTLLGLIRHMNLEVAHVPAGGSGLLPGGFRVWGGSALFKV